jgi:hypothetical protein
MSVTTCVLNTALTAVGLGRFRQVKLIPVTEPVVEAAQPDEVIKDILKAPIPAAVAEVLEKGASKSDVVKTIPAVLRAVVQQKDAIDHALTDDTAARKGVTVTVIDDSQIPADVGSTNAEVIIAGPRSTELYAAAQEAMFWDNFIEKLAQRKVLDFHSALSLIEHQATLGKGYSAVNCKEVSEHMGIVHVTKAGLNALFPLDDGTYRVVSNNKRFNGEAFVSVAAAKGFLNGRY